jgi:hypothetical protein
MATVQSLLRRKAFRSDCQFRPNPKMPKRTVLPFAGLISQKLAAWRLDFSPGRERWH